MGRRFLLQVLAGVVTTIGLTAAPAVAAEVAPIGTSLDIAPVSQVAEQTPGDDPLSVELPGVAEVTADVDTDAPAVSATVEPKVEASEADTRLTPKVTVEVSPDGPKVDVAGPVELGGQDLPLDETTDPVEETVGRPPAAEPAPPFVESPAPTRTAGEDVAPAPKPAADDAPAARSGGRAVPRGVTRGMSAGTGAAIDAPEVAPFDDSVLAPEIASAAPAPAEDAEIVSALPIVDTTPTVPALLRLMTGVLVIGAGATWRMVRETL